MKVLYVGDPHVKASNIGESEALLKFVRESAVRHNVERIVILGDLFHTHAVIRLEVLEFWGRELFSLTLAAPETYVLVGNHDQSGDYKSDSHALGLFKKLQSPKLIIADCPLRSGAMAYVPYIHDQATFTAAANKLADEGAKTLVCHQTFSGAKFDNGMYAPDGFETEILNYNLVISGHIHTASRFGKVIYPGTATWQTASDANKDKGLWLVEHDESGSIVSEEYLDTSKVVQPIYEITWKEGSAQPAIPEGRVTLELVGSSAWVSQQKPLFKGKISLKSKITDKAENRVRKSAQSLSLFLETFKAVVTREELMEAMKEFSLE